MNIKYNRKKKNNRKKKVIISLFFLLLLISIFIFINSRRHVTPVSDPVLDPSVLFTDESVLTRLVNNESVVTNFVNSEFSYLEYIDNNLPQRFSGTQQEKYAADFIYNELTSFGYSPVVKNFSFNWNDENYNSQNVIAKKSGISDNYKIIIGAHYDSVQTPGIDDNASGVSLILACAKEFSNIYFPYDVEFIFFGSEETGLRGSKAYVQDMTEEDIDKTLVMINADTLLCGTYRYVYSGSIDNNNNVIKAQGAYLTQEIAQKLGIDIRLNNTDISAVKSPTAVEHSDHASFQYAGIPYIYFESTNWELPDNKEPYINLSTGDYQTEIGRIMHNPQRDNLSFILSTFGTRARENMQAYTIILPNLVLNIMNKIDLYAS